MGQPGHPEVHQGFPGARQGLQGGDVAAVHDPGEPVVLDAAAGLRQVGLPGGAARAGGGTADLHTSAAQPIHVRKRSHSD